MIKLSVASALLATLTLANTAQAQIHTPGTHAVRCQINKEQLIIRDREHYYWSHSNDAPPQGMRVHSPSRTFTGNAPDCAVAQCGDDTFSFSHHDPWTCSGHGGVKWWLDDFWWLR